MLLAGKKIDGWKAVEGRRARTFTDPDIVPDRLRSLGYSPEMAYERKILTPPQLEKVLGKNEFEEAFSDLVVKSKGKPTLALSSDSRPEFSYGTKAEDDFKINTKEEI